ncbi:MAG: hypothetical protein BWK79_03430 [Beggiatoa sp. IS2]|nr:MAG: hypothetical protein BWK79_03430 [Beggiatoa sp. IS2]
MTKIVNTTVPSPSEKIPTINSWWDYIFPIIRQIIFLSLLWWIITQGNQNSWNIGIVVIGLAVISSVLLRPKVIVRLSLVNSLIFWGFILWKIVLSGVEVSYRVLHPQLPIAPIWLDYPLHVPADSAAGWLFTQVASLMPSTVSVQLGTQYLRVHILAADDRRAAQELYHLEKRIAALFFITIE